MTDGVQLLDLLAEHDVVVWAEGTRLRFRAPKGRLTEALREQLMANKQAVLNAWRARAGGEKASHPASQGQRALWFLNQSMPESSSYNVLVSARIRSTIDLGAFRHACQALVDRHPSLRTTFATEGNRLVQQIHGHLTVDLRLHDRPDAELAQLEQEVIQHSRVPFDLGRGSLLRIELFSRAADDHVLLIAVHHIAADGWSVFLLLDDLRLLYPAECNEGSKPPPPRPASDVVEFARWQEEMIASPVGRAHERYWTEALAGEVPVLDLPMDRRRPATLSDAGSSIAVDLGLELSEAVRALAAASGTTPYVVLLAIYQVLLHRYSGQAVIVVGSPTYGRDRPEFADVVGDFINMITQKGDFSADPTFSDFLGELRRRVLQGIEHQDYPFPLLVERLQPQRDPSHTPIFQTIFVLQKFTQLAGLEGMFSSATAGARVEFGGLALEAFVIPQQEGQIDLSLELVELGSTYKGQLKYNTDLYDAATITALVRHYSALLRAIVAAPQTPVSQFPMLDAAERRALVVQFNATEQAFPPAVCLHELFLEQVRRTPDALAVRDCDRAFTYRELDRCSSRLARRLRERGVVPDALVPLLAERSPELIVGILGILKAGGAYVPIDPTYPADRIAFMLEDTRASLVLTQKHLSSVLPVTPATVIHLDDMMREPADAPLLPPDGFATSPRQLAYVIYTSGSTGRPKGVAVEHASLYNLVCWHRLAYQVTADDRATLVAGPAFDASVWEIWPYLTAGASLHIPGESMRANVDSLVRWLADERITLTFLPTPLAEMALSTSWPKHSVLRAMLTGGDKLHQHPRQELPFRLVNHYGPTENTVVSTWTDVETGRDLATAPPIGRPLPNTQAYILDRNRQPLPVGTPGELYVGGVQVARGYWNLPELTAERFVPDPFRNQPGARLYRTGDICRYRAGGTIEFLGRTDYQVKIRGFRIELGEIEDALVRNAKIKAAVVVVHERVVGEKRLVAYLAPRTGQAPSPVELRDFLRTRLPEYMTPSAFVLMEKLPLDPNGKIDRKALPEPDAADLAATRAYVAPETATETLVAQVFAETLNVSAVGLHHNFFELGGHSLLATRALALLRERFKIEIPVNAFFQAPTAHGLSRWLDAAAERKASPGQLAAVPTNQPAPWKCLVPARSKGSHPPLFLATGFMDADDCMRILSNLIPHVGPDQPLCGLRPRWLDGRSPSYSSVAEVTAEFMADLRAFQPRGPYYLVGDCVQGVVAVEMARTLMEQGDEVALLVLLDSERPRFHSFFLTGTARLWDRGRHIAQVLRQFVRPTEGTRRQVMSDLVQRKLRRASLGKNPITATDDIYVKRVGYGQLLRRHRLKRYAGRITLILTDKVYRIIGFLGWKGFAEGGLEVYRTPGDHETFRGEYSRELGQRLRLCIDRAQSESEQRRANAAMGTPPHAVQKPE